MYQIGTAAWANFHFQTVMIRRFPFHRNLNVYLTQLSRNKSSVGNGNGLFGIENLKVADDFTKLTTNAVRTIDYIRDKLLTKTNLNPKQTLLLLDSISNELCSVIDVAELCRNIHENDDFQYTAEQSFESLSGVIHKLNTDKRVYTKLVDLMDTPHIWNTMSYEERSFMKDLRAEFESDGIHLVGNQKKSSFDLKSSLVSHETAFSQNATSDNKELVIGPFPPKSNVAVLKQWLDRQCGIPQRQFSEADKYIICSSDRRILGSLLRSIEQENLREDLYRRAINEPHSNVEALGNLVQTRQILAKTLGFKSHAHKYLLNKVLNTPEEVQTFLKSISVASKAQTLKELKVLADLKASQREQPLSSKIGSVTESIFGQIAKPFTKTPAPSQQSVPQPIPTTLQPWDVAYYSSQHQAQHMNDEGRKESAVNAVQAFLPVDACIEGLRLVSQRLFGIRLEDQPMERDERWTDAPTDSKQARKDDIRKLVVVDEEGAKIGTVYLDLYTRGGKFPGAAHFTIRCGCTTFDTAEIDHSVNNDVLAQKDIKLGEVQQLPVVALVFNFSQHRTSSSGESSAQPLLSLQDLETLYHEWGHALHSLLSRTRFQHLSGTRGGVDFIEVPSHLMEYFARSPEVVSLWARHHLTGERVPQQLVRDALSRKGDFAAIELQQQVLFSAADQYLFGTGIGDLSSLTGEEVFARAVSGLADLQREYTVLPLLTKKGPDGQLSDVPSMNLLNHSHFVSYGGGYYSYLFAKMYAAQIWRKRFAADPLSRSAGDMLWHHMLIFGSGRDPKEMLHDLAGGELDPRHYLDTVLTDEEMM